MITVQEEKFAIIYKNSPVNVETLMLGGLTLYLVKFSDRSPMMIAQEADSTKNNSWTSIPKGRQGLAEEIGELVEEQIKQHA